MPAARPCLWPTALWAAALRSALRAEGLIVPQGAERPWLCGSIAPGKCFGRRLFWDQDVESPLALPKGAAPAGAGPTGVRSKPALGDVNGDGRPDLVLGGDGGSLDLYLGQRDGSFAKAGPEDNPFRDVVAPGGYRSAPALGDVNGDGRSDLVLGGGGLGGDGGSLDVYLGQQDGSFARAGPEDNPFRDVKAPGGLDSAPAVGDVNGDGRPDLVLGGRGESLDVYLAQQDGSFAKAGPEDTPFRDVVAAWGGYNPAPALGDVNGDGRSDLVLGGSSGSLDVYLGQQDGSFAKAGPEDNPFRDVVALGGKYKYSAPALGDVNGDGRPDLVLGGSYGSVDVYLAQQDGSFAKAGPEDNRFRDVKAPGGSYSAPALGDVNGDGRPDLVLGGDGGRLDLYPGQRDGSFAKAGPEDNPFRDVVAPGGSYSAPALGDVNGDGRPDLVLGGEGGTLDVYLALPNRPFFTRAGPEHNPFRNVRAPAPGIMSAPALGDVNGDGRPDLVLGGYGGTLDVYLRLPNGSFARAGPEENPFHNVIAPGRGGRSAPALGDVNGDGFPDLVLGGYGGGLDVYLGQQNGSFNKTSTEDNPFRDVLAPGGGWSKPAMGDVNGAGFLDLVLGGYGGGLDLYVRGHCTTPCSYNGVCGLSRTCRCYAERGLSDCSGCSPGFFGSLCKPCPGVMDDNGTLNPQNACDGIGTCSDFASAHSDSERRLSRRGTGDCTCITDKTITWSSSKDRDRICLSEKEKLNEQLDEQKQLQKKRQTMLIVVGIIGLIASTAMAYFARDLFRRHFDARRHRRIQGRLGKDKFKTKHKFFFVKASKLREWTGGPLPKHQALREQGGWLDIQEIDVGVALRSPESRRFLIISHRWFTPQHPDPEGLKVLMIMQYLDMHPEVEFVWLDHWCLPQWTQAAPRTEDEEVVFQDGLANIYMLFLTCWVFSVFDLQYMGRFWTSYEFWLSLQNLTSSGLEPASKEQRRIEVRCIGASEEAEELLCKSMFQTWGGKSAADAAKTLLKDDVIVTNQRDKEQQVEKLRDLAANARDIYERSCTSDPGEATIEIEMSHLA